jgi:hypothetical protein
MEHATTIKKAPWVEQHGREVKTMRMNGATPPFPPLYPLLRSWQRMGTSSLSNTTKCEEQTLNWRKEKQKKREK